VVCADLLERIPPEAVAALFPEEGRFVESSKNPFFEEAFDLLLVPCETGATGGAVSLLRFLPNFFFVVVSNDADAVADADADAVEVVVAVDVDVDVGAD